MKPLYFSVLFLVLPFMMQAQVEGVEKEIRNYQDSRSQLVYKGRKMLLDKFLEGDIEKVKEIKDYLLSDVANEDYLALYPEEQWMIMYWTGEYESLTNSILQFNQDSTELSGEKLTPEPDLLYQKLIEKSWEQLELLENNINNSELELQTRDFLLLHLNFMVSGEPLNKLSLEEVNAMADLYMETHPESSYEEYIRNNIRYQYVPYKWGLGLEFFTGAGMFKGELSELYNNHGVLGVGIDLEYQKFTLFLRNYIGFSTTKQDKEKNEVVWNKGSQTHIFLPEASIGYAVIETDKIKLSPYAGIGAADISPTSLAIEERPELEGLGTGFYPTYTIGLNFNLRLGWDASNIISQRPDNSYWFLRVRYGYTRPQFNEALHGGNVHQITLGFGGMYKGMKRVL